MKIGKWKINRTKVLMALALVSASVLLLLNGTGSEEEFPLGTADVTKDTTEELYKGATVDTQWPKAMEVPARMKDGNEQLLKRDGYWASYNKERKVPNWVAWHLTAAHTKGDNQRDDVTFAEDEDVPYPRSTDADYVGSHYDRGHLCPAGDNKWERRALVQTFKFTNVCPQNHSLNKGDWNDLEMQCRYWARKMGDVYIVAGPVFYDGVKKTIGKNRVAVPDAFFKVILSDRGKAKAIGFIYPNKGGHRDMSEYVRSVDEVEQITGLDFFSKLEDTLEEQLESESKDVMVKQWNIN